MKTGRSGVRNIMEASLIGLVTFHLKKLRKKKKIKKINKLLNLVTGRILMLLGKIRVGSVL